MAEYVNTTMQEIAAVMAARIPAMIVGEPGVGKTASMRAFADSIEYELVTLLGSQMDPTDVTGLPKGEKIMDDADGNPVWGTVYLAPWWQVKIMRKKKVILFFDEFSNTSSAVRASLLTMLQNREFPNGETMPPETIVVGAMNPTEQAADGWELDAPTTNRMVFLKWKTTAEEWYTGMLNAWGKEEQTSEAEMAWRRLVVRFLKDSPTYLSKMNNEETGTPEALGVNYNDPSEAEILRYAWASRRSWDNLSRILAHTEDDAHTIQDTIASGTVGRSAATAFRAWLQKNSAINPHDVIKNPKSIDWTTIGVSDANILFPSIVELIDAKNWRQVLNVLEVVAEQDRAALVGAYINDMLTKIVQTTRVVGKKELEDARTVSKTVLQKYRSVAKAPATEGAVPEAL